jgi:hypothetical protein
MATQLHAGAPVECLRHAPLLGLSAASVCARARVWRWGMG